LAWERTSLGARVAGSALSVCRLAARYGRLTPLLCGACSEEAR